LRKEANVILGDLLEELRENILSDRSNQVSGAASDQLWSDKTLVRYINAAQDRFAKRSECLRDKVTPETCRLKLVVGQQDYALHEKVIGVLSARYMGPPDDGFDLARAGHANLDTYRAVDNRFFDTSNIVGLQPGKIIAFTTDEGMMADGRNALNTPTFRAFPNVGDGFDGTVALRVVRFPIHHLHLDDLNGRPEIPEQYHLNMLDWAGYLALRRPDLDVAGGDAPGRAKDLATSFQQHVEDAKRELRRRMFQPLAWQFGRNGYTFERDWN
jgi:hypothetical protein